MFLDKFKKKSNNDQKKQHVGMIANYLSEQFIARDFEAMALPYENFAEVLEQNNFDAVFVESSIYEVDHPWYGHDIEEVLAVLDKLDVRVIIITSEEQLPPQFEKYFSISIDPYAEDISISNNGIAMPPILDEEKFNPVDNKLATDIVYLKMGPISHYSNFEEYHKKFKPKLKQIEMEEISREGIVQLIETIKKANILYIYHSSGVDHTLIRYLEAIAALQNTIVLLDEGFDINSRYSAELTGLEAFVDYKRTVINSTLFRDKQIISKIREAFMTNTLVMKPKLNKLIAEDRKLGIIDNQPVEISVIVATKRKANLDHIVSYLNDQKYVNIQAIILTHGFKLTRGEKSNLLAQSNFEVKFVSQSEKVSFGNCLNKCIRHIKYDYVTKMDDDDYYFSNYLIDVWLGLKYSQYTLTGKNAFFFYLEQENLTGQRRMQKQYKKVTEVKGNTLFCTTETMKKYKFQDLPRHVDSDFIQRIKKDGGRVYGIHPYDMCVFRANDKTGHTYQVNDSRFLRDADVLYYGPPNETISSD